MSYNYAKFKPSYYDLATFSGPQAGDTMPDLKLIRPDGTSVRLSALWSPMLVLETGSVTCPIYSRNVAPMTSLASEFPDTHFAVLYIREAHPGERVGPHHSQAQKLERAASLPNILAETRQILVDDIDGTAHQALGSQPDMVYVIKDGVVLFRGDWNHPEVVREVLSGTASPELLRQDHFPPAKPTPSIGISALMRGGYRAAFDFAVGFPGLLAAHSRADKAFQSDGN